MKLLIYCLFFPSESFKAMSLGVYLQLFAQPIISNGESEKINLLTQRDES